MRKTTAIIIAFNRPRYTLDCITSLRRSFPDIDILVGNNGFAPEDTNCVDRHTAKQIVWKMKSYGAKYVELPFDCGVGYARNTMMRMVKTPYALIGDDDFYYTAAARLHDAEVFLDNHPEYSIVGGRISWRGKVLDYQGYVSKAEEGYHYQKLPANKLRYDHCEASQLNYCQVDMMTNFWVGRLADLPPFNEDHKIHHEHIAYMIELLGKVPMAFTPEMTAEHKHTVYQYPDYGKYRYRASEKNYLVERFGGVKT